ncbi:MAG: DUF1684 domain-containing protein [Nitrospiraceae bacterium]
MFKKLGWLRKVEGLGLLLLAVGLGACWAERAELDQDYVRQIERWRAQRLESLQSETGWLTLVGLFWLQPGHNRFGTDSSNELVLPQGSAPPFVGSFFLDEEGHVQVHSDPDAGLTLQGEPVTKRNLRADHAGEPDILRLNDLMLYLIKRGDRYAIRAKDPNSPTRKNFMGLEHYPEDQTSRDSAQFVPYETPREVAVPTILGTVQPMAAPGYVKFVLNGEALTLEPVVESPNNEELFFIFKDETSGKETYPAGRFLYADRPEGGQVVLDFNKAYNPPCAFTPYATCPLPPQQNWLSIHIEAGEKNYGDH